MTSPDRAPDDPPEATASTHTHTRRSRGQPPSPIATHRHHWSAPAATEAAFEFSGVSPTTKTLASPTTTTPRSPRPTTSFPAQLVVETGSDVLDPLSLLSISPSQITPLESVVPVTPGASATAAKPSASASTSVSPGYARSPRRKLGTDQGPISDIDPPAGIPFPDDSMSQPFEGPSSAPPTPSVISVTHPSQFIHTHHPRRGSLTPLGLNVISPVPPPQAQSLEGSPGYPRRSVGFNSAGGNDAPSDASRRDSVASVASNLTATRPATYSMSAVAGSSSSATLFNASRRRSSLTPSLPNLAPPSNFNGSKRRSSLTPSLPTLAAPSPTRALVAGRVSARPPSSEGTYLPVHSRTMDVLPGAGGRRASAAALLGSDTRRGSLPHLYYGAWTGPGTPTAREPWNPALSSLRGSVDDSLRGSVDDTALIDQSFKFGNPPAAAASSLASSSTGSRTAESGDEPGSGSHQRLGGSSSSGRRKELSAFEAAEQEEADRQRRAFLAATYGEDSRRARARLSLGGPSGASPGSPASTRRQSLLLWERIHKPPEAGGMNQSTTAAAMAAAAAATAVPAPVLHQTLEKELGRRPSLPINIPMRTPPAQTSESFDDQSIWDDPDSIDPNLTPVRPLPPLLPLSDPVPRLLPSTLALHRATHLLNARGIASEPLPAPLPPSLHPPVPVDLSEFDIDFILAGSRSNLGRQGSTSSKGPSAENVGRNGPLGGGGGGGGEEDSFAKFVGAFDDEYGERRGDWTFRACPPSSSLPPSPHDDGEPSLPRDPTRPRPRVQWDCPGAGRFEIYANGDVRSVETGAVWRIRKTSSREYEFEQPLRIPNHMLPTDSQSLSKNAPQPLIFATCGGYTLTSKLVHTENGGVKLPFAVYRELSSKGSRVSRRFAAARHRQSLVVQDAESGAAPRTKRLGSEDSGATAIPHAIPINHHLANASNAHHLATSMPPSRPIMSTPTSPNDDPHAANQHSTPKEIKRLSRGRQREPDDDKHKKMGSSFGGVLKRGLFRAQSLVKEYEERNKDRHSSNGGHGSGHGTHNQHQHHHWGPLSAGSSASRPSPSRPTPTERPSDRSDTASASSQHSSGKLTNESADELADWPGDAPFGSLGLGIEDEQNGGLPWKEGKAWEGVPDEALAMVIPIESDSRTPHPPQSPAVTQPFINPFFVDGPRQALLVWFTPFNAESAPPESRESRESRVGSSSTLFKIAEAPHHEETSPLGTSLRLPKLLRPRSHRLDGPGASHLASSKTIPIPPPTTTPPSDFDLQPIHERSRRESRNFLPLPFKSFRVVAKVVDTEDLRSEPEVPVIALEQWTEQMRTGKPAGLHTPPLDGQARMDDGLGAAPAFPGEPSRSPSIADSGVLSGRAFPTVIAVCHSQSSGVEFVLEGLDRLGLCTGGNAWGPTGYEEWRGTGLSENGRQALDLLWAACSAIMGI